MNTYDYAKGDEDDADTDYRRWFNEADALELNNELYLEGIDDKSIDQDAINEI